MADAENGAKFRTYAGRDVAPLKLHTPQFKKTHLCQDALVT